MKLTKEQLLGIVRHTVTFIGGLLVMKGLVDDSIVQEILGGVTTLVGAIWSIVDKKKGINFIIFKLKTHHKWVFLLCIIFIE